MSNDRFYKNLTAIVPHRQSKEERDLRNDLYAALSDVADSVDKPGTRIELSAVTPVPGAHETVIRAQALKGSGTSPLAEVVPTQLTVFQEADGINFSAADYLDTPTVGTLLAGSGTAAIKMKTNASGLFECKLKKPAVGTAYLAASSTPGGPVVNSTGTLAVSFT